MNRLDAMKERLTKATPGPWRHKPGIIKHYVYSEYSSGEGGDLYCGVERRDGGVECQIQEFHPCDGRDTNAVNDASLIAHAPDDLRDLLAVAEMATHYPVCIDCAASRDQDGQIEHEPGCSVGALLMEVEA